MRFRIRSPASRNTKPASIGGKIVATLFFLVFFTIGCFAAYLLGHEILKTIGTYSWPATAATIISSSIEHNPSSDEPHELKVSFRYDWEGQSYISDQYSTSKAGFDKYAKAQKILVKYPAGTQTTAYVNPQKHSSAILVRRSLWFCLFILLPAVFIVIGGGGIYLTWMASGDLAKSRAPRATPKSRKKGRRALLSFGLIFLLIGLGVLVPLFILPVSGILKARTWVAVPATVISSRVESHSSDDGDTYSVEIFYRYAVDGKEYKSDRYHFLGGSSSGYSSKAEAVEQHPAGKEIFVYVSPNDPTDAVISRDFTWTLLFGLIPLLFAIIGAGSILLSFKTKTAVSSAQSVGVGGTDGATISHGTPPGPVQLKPAASRLGKLFGIIFFGLFWNGILSVFVWQVWEGWSKGSPDWFLTLFLIPFLLVGMGCIFGIFYLILALFNPKPSLTVNSTQIPLGDSLHIDWQISGNTRRLKNFVISLEGAEQATYRRGTDTVTDTEIFYKKEIFSTTNQRSIATGKVTARIPNNLMHSFDGDNNKIIWTLKISGDIPRWPDVGQQFSITVLPQRGV